MAAVWCRWHAGLLAGLVFTGFHPAATAQDYPAKAVRWIVPFAAGGGGDIIIRTIAQRLGERLGQPVVVDNRAGAGGSLGTEIAA